MPDATTIYLVRHGDVENPKGIIYGHLPGYGLSALGCAQMRTAAEMLVDRQPFDTLFTSPLERAQQSAAPLAERLKLQPTVDGRIAETDVHGYQGRSFDELPSPYLTEAGVPGIESAASMRARMIAWLADARRHDRVVAVTHRDPIAILLLYWMGLGLSRLSALDVPTGSVHEVQLDGGKVALSGPAIG